MKITPTQLSPAWSTVSFKNFHSQEARTFGWKIDNSSVTQYFRFQWIFIASCLSLGMQLRRLAGQRSLPIGRNVVSSWFFFLPLALNNFALDVCSFSLTDSDYQLATEENKKSESGHKPKIDNFLKTKLRWQCPTHHRAKEESTGFDFGETALSAETCH